MVIWYVTCFVCGSIQMITIISQIELSTSIRAPMWSHSQITEIQVKLCIGRSWIEPFKWRCVSFLCAANRPKLMMKDSAQICKHVWSLEMLWIQKHEAWLKNKQQQAKTSVLTTRCTFKPLRFHIPYPKKKDSLLSNNRISIEIRR